METMVYWLGNESQGWMYPSQMWAEYPHRYSREGIRHGKNLRQMNQIARDYNE